MSFVADAVLMTGSALVDDSAMPGVSVVSAPPYPLFKRLSHRAVRVLRPDHLVTRAGGLVLLGAGLAGAVLAIAGLAGAARLAPWTDLLASPEVLVVMVAATVGGYVMQSLSIVTLLRARASRRDALLLPWASASVNRVTPGAAGGLVLTARVLHRRGVTYAGAAVYLASIGVTHTLAGLALFAIAIAAGGASGRFGLPLGGPGWLLPMSGLIISLLLLCVPWTRVYAADLLRRARDEVSLRRLPAVVVFQAGARLAPAIVLAAALAGLHHSLPFATVVAIVVLASATGSLVPLPSGAGGVELALTGLLTTSGLSLEAASASVLVARLVGFWLPAALGLPALLALRRSVGASCALEGEGAEMAVTAPVPSELGLLVPIAVPVAAAA